MSVFLIVLVSLVGISTADTTPLSLSERQGVRDASNHYRSAESHRRLAARYLQEAVDRSLSSRVGDAQAELDRAAEEYLACAKSTGSKVDESTRIKWAAAGLLASYRAQLALKLILEHPEVGADPEILRIKADALLVLGLREEAALAYERWIGDGKCISTYRLWPGEPQTTGVLLLPKGVKDNCAILPPELRARLETLLRLYNHPNNLPAHNFGTWPRDTK